MIEGFPYIASTLCFVAAVFTVLLATAVALKDHRSFAHRSFIAGLALLAVVETLRGLGYLAITPQETIYWHRLRLVASSFLPGTWLLFSLTFARTEYRQHLTKWKYGIAAVFVIPIFTAALFTNSLVAEPSVLAVQHVPLGQAGKTFQLFFLLSSIVILSNLERTLRASVGRIRWQIKFVVLGLAGLCAVWIYISSQALLYSFLDAPLSLLNPVTLLGVDLLFIWGLIRSRFLKVDVYLSHTTIQYSLTIVFAGAYLVAVGLLAQVVRRFSPERPLPLDALLVLVALTGLAILVLSDRLQERLKRLVSRHFRRPRYDYRKAWMELTQRTTSLSDPHELCTEAAKIISKTLGFLSVNIWLCDETKSRLILSGSTVFTRSQSMELVRAGHPAEAILNAVGGRYAPLDLQENRYEWPEDIMRSKPEYFRKFRMRYALPVQTGGELIGILTLNEDRVGEAPLSLEDQDLLHAYIAQLAASVLQLRLSENVREAKELEAFQNVSTFFVHDLKNLAARLRLTMQNLPTYFDDPNFRADALQAIAESLSKIDGMCDRLSSLRRKTRLHRTAENLNELVSKTIEDLQLGTKVIIRKDLKPMPAVPIDGEQIQKVITNLILNAREAMNDSGEVRVSTVVYDDHVELSVKDSGCGMTQDFIANSLFRPFRTTKTRGIGIGLYQSKMIVEAHRGRIEVESAEGKGSMFRVVLPLNPA